MSTHPECDSADDALSIFKKLVVDGDCEPYTDCENTSDSIESLIKRMLYVDDSDNVYLNICT